jgi:NADPH:quinone reductase-like Zn-dependent oxidoreductase
MRAVFQTGYGSPDAFRLREVRAPTLRKDTDVLVRVHAAALHAGDVFMMRGVPYFTRLVVGFPKPRNYIPGYDVAGRVEAVGKGVTQFKVGDEVYGSIGRTCAEFARAPEDQLEKKPANLSMEQAAAVPTSAIAALHGIRDAGTVKPGQKVLINGASGGVGTFAVQIAKAYGAEVTGVAFIPLAQRSLLCG